MIKTQIWRPNTCTCVIMQKWDSEFPEVAPTYITGEEYIDIIKNLLEEKPENVITLDQAKEIAKSLAMCDLHAPHGKTPKMMEEVLKHNKLENQKKK